MKTTLTRQRDGTDTAPEAVILGTTTIDGLHRFVIDRVISRFAQPGERAIDLGAGSGALATRLKALGLDVMASDKNSAGFKAAIPFSPIDLDERDFSAQLGEGTFSLVTAVEVIEHVEAPIGLLRNACRLLKPGGVIVITTPNVDNIPARIKFLLKEKVRLMDDVSEPTHISPIFWELFNRQFLPRAGLELVEHHLFPPRGYTNTRPRYIWAMRCLAPFLSGRCKYGDVHVFVLRPRKEGT